MATNEEIKQLKSLMRSIASQRSYDLTNELDAYGIKRIAPIPAKVRSTKPRNEKLLG